MFWLKKAVSFWLMPLPLCLVLIVPGLVLAFATRRSKLGRCLLFAGVGLLVLFTNKAASNALLATLEHRFPAVPELAPGAPAPDALARCAYVAVLGGGHTDMPEYPATSQLSSSALGRLVEAIRILRVLPGARLIVSGPGSPGRPTHADVLAAAAVSLGVEPTRILRIDTAHDTEDESFAVARAARGGRVALVTSAWHMPRAALLFKRAGVDFAPCPADFACRDNIQRPWAELSWDSESLERSTRAIHEWLGLLWLRLKG